jgi:hypothetical protein
MKRERRTSSGFTFAAAREEREREREMSVFFSLNSS